MLRHELRAVIAERHLSLSQSVKKPFNPLLGEVFYSYWNHEDASRTIYVAEQVVHHPPISAIYAENRKHNITMNAQIYTKSKFLGLWQSICSRTFGVYLALRPMSRSRDLDVSRAVSQQATLLLASTSVSSSCTSAIALARRMLWTFPRRMRAVCFWDVFVWSWVASRRSGVIALV